ncbi:type I-G CRISPR-associated protein Csb2 [Azospirillum sp. sgz302134]
MPATESPTADSLWLSVAVRFLHGRFHGQGDGGRREWPPSPARLFQALVAAAGALPEDEKPEAARALLWLEGRPPPVIQADPAPAGNPYALAVPNNDGDLPALAWAKGQEPKDQQKPEALRTLKTVRASLVEDVPVTYHWPLDPADAESAAAIARLARQVTTLGWGIDAVAVDGSVANDPPSATGSLWKPGSGSSPLRVPAPGFLAALDRRHALFHDRLDRRGRAMRSPPPVTGFAVARYAAPGEAEPAPWLAYRLTNGDGGFVLVPDAALPSLVDALRERLERVLGPQRAALVALCPLPSLGHRHADGAVRRLLAVLPPGSGKRAVEELDFALDRASLTVAETAFVLERDTPEDSPFLGLAVAPDGAHPTVGRLWRSVFALRPATGKATPQAVRTAVLHAASEAGIAPGRIAHLRTFRPPPWPHRPAAGPGALHVELELTAPQDGPLVLRSPQVAGEGGLPALFATAPLPTMARFVLAGRDRPPVEDTALVADRFRRAALAMWGHDAGPVPAVLGGHDAKGRPLSDPAHTHMFWLAEDADGDGRLDHLVAYARHGLPAPVRDALDRLNRVWLSDGREWRTALEGFGGPDDFPDCRLTGAARHWVSLTPWYAPWHAKPRFGAEEMIRRELLLRGIVRKEQADALRVEETDALAMPAPGHPVALFRRRSGRRGPQGKALRITLPATTSGPLALGADCHFGLGLFSPQW